MPTGDGFIDLKTATPEECEKAILLWEDAIRAGLLDDVRQAQAETQNAQVKLYELHRWLEHKPGCPRRYRFRLLRRIGKTCNCGLDEVLNRRVYTK
jgi:hypothetical protein